MTPLAWMAGASVLSWLAVSAVGGSRVNPEVLAGMLAPLASGAVTWLAVRHTWRTAPERLTGVMVLGFGAKLVFFGLYVAVMIRGFSMRPVPFVASFVSYFIVLYGMQAFFLRRLTAPR